ncbi:HAD hydrolase-like protein [Tumebacillus permanentifrigoris]|uniref:Phosphoglycolate phosphatase-like HAD superfamily hydrolase n=1 Tax=Tumebacillus permanentifrigoris TaxID=378543 RepID=A0A316D3H0_9BACL|nr:HAD hydrolase-like protein [Tumebacillus permanentifrigoris]PWK05973.1 phosphoglycolate phosphatase-like HAD superfamily hydrolase [Tumebacillus permanentifrigoris]
MKRLLLWDIDGTLMHCRGCGKRAMEQAFEQVYGIADAFHGIGMAGGLDLHFIEGAFAKHALPNAEADMPQFLDLYYKLLQREADSEDNILLPGVVSILEHTLHEPAWYNALGTGNFERGARIKLDVHDLNSYFPVGGFCEVAVDRSVMLQKGVDNASAHYNISFSPEQVVVIGDTDKDIQAARAIGAQVVAVATGGCTYETLEALHPDLLLRDFSEPSALYAFLLKNSVK